MLASKSQCSCVDPGTLAAPFHDSDFMKRVRCGTGLSLEGKGQRRCRGRLSTPLLRAHIVSQRLTWQHVHVHWLMLKLGASIGDWREIRGQLSRIVAAAVFSRIWVPVGNTGRANVSALKPMPMPEDLRILIEQSGV